MLCVQKLEGLLLGEKNKIGVRAGARTGYVIPGRDGIGGLDPARNSSAVVVVVVAVRGEGEGGGGRDSKY